MPEALLITAEDFERMPRGNYRDELVEGRLVRMSLPGIQHGAIAATFSGLLSAHVKRHGLGVVLLESGFTLVRNPDTVRGPDVAFISRERLTSAKLPKGFWKGAPDLAIEVLSPDNRASALRKKIDDYLKSGALGVVVIDPVERTVRVHRRLAPPVMASDDEILSLEDIVPGFFCAVREIFEL